MTNEVNHQIEVNKMIASIEKDTGIKIESLKNCDDILKKIHDYVRKKESKIRSIEENKKSIVKSILKENKYSESKKKVFKRRPIIRKKKKSSALKIASETDTNATAECSSIQVTKSVSASVLDSVESADNEEEAKPKRRISHKVKRKSRKSLQSVQQPKKPSEEGKLVNKPAKSATEACRDILKHIAEVDESRALTETNKPTYDTVKFGMESSYCLRDWREVFVSKPENFNFYDFINGNTYKKSVKLTNKTAKVVMCRFHSIYYPDCLHMDRDLMSIDFKNEIKLYPGLSFQFNMTLCPKNLETDFKVELIFVANINNYMAFLPIPVEGLLTDSLIVVEPLTVDFGLKPVWPIKDKSKKYRKEIIITCFGRRPIEMFIKKCDEVAQSYMPVTASESSVQSVQTHKSISSIMAIDNSITNRSESDMCGSEKERFDHEELSKTAICVSNFLDDCIDMAIDVFYFEKRHVTLKPNVPNKVYVWFKNAKNLGYHQGQFNLEFFKYGNKAGDKKTLMLYTKKKITLFSETYDLPLVITPTTLDLTTAKKKNGCISSSFAIYNSHKNLSTHVEINETKLEKHSITITPDDVFIQPMKLQKFQISYSAKNDSQEDILKDSVVNISVSIMARIKNEKYLMAPPLHIQIYAPYNL